MIPPASDEDLARTLPGWALHLMALNVPHVVGLPVIDVLYAGAYGQVTRGEVRSARLGSMPCACCKGIIQQFVGVSYPNGGSCGSLGSYWVANLDTERGREHVGAWLLAQIMEVVWTT